MHIKPIVICSLLIPHLLAAPISGDSRGPLIEARSVQLAFKRTVQLATFPSPATVRLPPSPLKDLKFTPQVTPGSYKFTTPRCQKGERFCRSRLSEDSADRYSPNSRPNFNGGTTFAKDTQSTSKAMVETSPHPKDWPSAPALEKMLKTDQHQATFWTGWKAGESNQATAEASARRHGGQTLEMGLVDGKAKMPVFKHDDKTATEIWSQAAKIFAQQASGDVHVHVAGNVRPNSIYELTEKQALLENERITSVTEHMHDGTKNVIIPERQKPRQG